MKKLTAAEEKKFYSSFKSIKKPQDFEVGQTVRLSGTHPFAGEVGTIVRFGNAGGKRPVVRIHDMQDHEVYVMVDSDAVILGDK